MTDTTSNTKVLRLRLKDKHAKFLRDLAREVNFVGWIPFKRTAIQSAHGQVKAGLSRSPTPAPERRPLRRSSHAI